MTPNPQHVAIAAKLQQAFKEIMPPGFKICALVIDTTKADEDGATCEMFVTRNVDNDTARDMAAAFYHGEANVSVRLVPLMVFGAPIFDLTDEEMTAIWAVASEPHVTVEQHNALLKEMTRRGLPT